MYYLKIIFITTDLYYAKDLFLILYCILFEYLMLTNLLMKKFNNLMISSINKNGLRPFFIAFGVSVCRRYCEKQKMEIIVDNDPGNLFLEQVIIGYINWKKLYKYNVYIQEMLTWLIPWLIKDKLKIKIKIKIHQELDFLSKNLILIIHPQNFRFFVVKGVELQEKKTFTLKHAYFAIANNKIQEFKKRGYDISQFLILNDFQSNDNIDYIIQLALRNDTNWYQESDIDEIEDKLFENLIKNIVINKLYQKKLCFEILMPDDFFNNIITLHKDANLIKTTYFKIIKDNYTILESTWKHHRQKGNIPLTNTGTIDFFYLNYYIKYHKY